MEILIFFAGVIVGGFFGVMATALIDENDLP